MKISKFHIYKRNSENSNFKLLSTQGTHISEWKEWMEIYWSKLIPPVVETFCWITKIISRVSFILLHLKSWISSLIRMSWTSRDQQWKNTILIEICTLRMFSKCWQRVKLVNLIHTKEITRTCTSKKGNWLRTIRYSRS